MRLIPGSSSRRHRKANCREEHRSRAILVTVFMWISLFCVCVCPASGLRSDLNAARSSAPKSSGCSQAAKWPPLSTSWK